LGSNLSAETTEERTAAAGRLVWPINRNWRFHAQRSASDALPGFDDSGFDRITIPHSNTRLPWHSFDDKSYEFVSLYRRHFRLPGEARGRHVFVDFEGVMTAAVVWINGQRLGEYRGGYTPFSFELTPHLDWERENVLAVEVDSTERSDIPPFGGEIDYLTFGGIYREVALRAVPSTYLENIFARPRDVLTDRPSVEVSASVAHLEPQAASLTLEAELRDAERVIARAQASLPPLPAATELASHELTLTPAGPVRRWGLADPNLYTVVVRIKRDGVTLDEDRRRMGFREARFTDRGFQLNGEVVKLRGLDRHQTFPFVGGAMPARVQRRDAHILKKELKCNIVRTSHYPQSRHFLDGCDEAGLLVLEEIPGWQHIGDQTWQDLAVDNVRRMVRRDWNHPSVVLWGVRINESEDNHDFYTRTNAAAHSLDPTRQTGGIRYLYKSELLEDVFTMNDFGFPLRPPNHPLYLNTEFVGHTYVTKSSDTGERQAEHIRRHARVHDQIASSPQYAGGIGWCAFDYNTHSNFGSGDRVCYHGVTDIFRLPKPAAGFYRSQCDPAEEIVLEPAFHWAARDDWSAGLETAVICSNCDHLKFYVGETPAAEADPDRTTFPHLPHPPFQLKLDRVPRGDLRIEGYLAGKKVIEKRCASNGVDRRFLAVADDTQLVADGADATRVVLRVTDEFGDVRRYSTAAITFALDGPAEIIGDNPLSLMGGCGAIWVRAKDEPGTVRLRATHPALGTSEVEIQVTAGEKETV
ncbi:MAG TPA: glycoside hydrolase family 2 TIM barrel-domain containing protein, partial [Candidatus Acidoferrales bacterium]|nr:glycoside hydrolase family 2 TIM barrel-domain containing protein [Candidatus Acidoferrales bacterium]